MPETRMSYHSGVLTKSTASPLREGLQDQPGNSGYFAVSPNGTQVPITKELFVAFTDFMKTRKCPGSIAIQFRGGEITCVEALARKTYRNA